MVASFSDTGNRVMVLVQKTSLTNEDRNQRWEWTKLPPVAPVSHTGLIPIKASSLLTPRESWSWAKCWDPCPPIARVGWSPWLQPGPALATAAIRESELADGFSISLSLSQWNKKYWKLSLVTTITEEFYYQRQFKIALVKEKSGGQFYKRANKNRIFTLENLEN